MSKNSILSKNILLTEWVEKAKGDSQVYQDRQAVEVLLAAIGINNSLQEALYLKGGTLFALAFNSDRVTADVDFSCVIDDHESFARDLSAKLNASMNKAAIKLGYLDTIFRVQKVKKMPKPAMFPDADFPALKVTIAYAEKDTSLERKLDEGICPHTISVDISFREQVYAFQELYLNDPLIFVKAYSLGDTIAEKYRAIFQQERRNRIRRQDVYDIHFLLENNYLAGCDSKSILRTLKNKCETRGFVATRTGFQSQGLYERSLREWHTLADEIPGDLPDFDNAFQAVKNYYESLPW